MIDCLIDFIGLKGVQDSPDSSRYVNDLAGITTQRFEDTREIDEDDGIEQAWNSLEERSIGMFELDVMNHLKKYFKHYTQSGSGITGFVDDNTLANHGSGKYSGWLFDLNNYSENMKIQINDVRINLASAENFNVKIFDANTGKELYTKAVTGIAGHNDIKIKQEYAFYNHNKLFVCYDTVIPYRVFTEPKTPGVVSQGSITTASTVLYANIDSSETGMSVAYNIKCGIDQFVCKRLQLFTEPFLLKLGIEFLKQSKYSTELNRYTLLDNETANELIVQYNEDYKEQLNAIFEDLEVPDDGNCFICNKEITKKVLIP